MSSDGPLNIDIIIDEHSVCVRVFVCMSVAVGSNLKEKMGASRGMGQWKFVQQNRFTS
jgi:hypothetical protein